MNLTNTDINQLVIMRQLDIQNRDKEIDHIQTQMIEINEIMQHLQIIVQDQGLIIDNIEQSIARSDDNITKGLAALNEANNDLSLTSLPIVTKNISVSTVKQLCIIM